MKYDFDSKTNRTVLTKGEIIEHLTLEQLKARRRRIDNTLQQYDLLKKELVLIDKALDIAEKAEIKKNKADEGKG